MVKVDTSVFDKNMRKTMQNLSDKGKLLDMIGIVCQRDITKHFEDEMSPTGRWKDISEKTKKMRTRRGSRYGQVLSDKGNLRKITYRKGNGDVKIGTSVDYGAVHNFGNPMANLPKREWAYISNNGQKKVDKAIELYLISSIGFDRKL